MSTSNIFSNVYIYGNCTVKGTLTTLGGSAVSQWTTAGSAIYYNTGNIGIGTATPGQLLSLNNGNILLAGTWTAGTTYSLIGYNTDKRLEFNYSNGTVIYDNNAFLVRTGGSSGGIGNLGLYQNATGYVGIGTTNPGSLLTVSGGGSFGSGYNAFTAPTGGLIVQGNVGIGTTNPGVNALQVTGNVVTSGFTSNATNTVFNFDTLTVPFLSATQISSGSTSAVQFSSNVDLSTGTMNVATVISSTGLMFRNRIINGDFRIDQRNNGASFTVSASAGYTYTLDRWWGWCQVGSKFSVQRSTEVPVGQGFINSVLVTSLSAYSTPVGGYYGFGQYIEGYNIADMGFGTASATTMTLSFWARSSIAGTFSVALENGSFNRSYIFNYTISSVNTWQYFTLPFRADTTGTWNSTTGQGLRIWWDLGSSDTTYASTAGSWLAADALRTTGSVSLIGTNAATLYIAGAQIEKGSAATPFEFRPYPTELAMCQRYYQVYGPGNTSGYNRFGAGEAVSSTQAIIVIPFQVTMRAAPSTYSNSAPSTFQLTSGASSPTVTNITAGDGSPTSTQLFATVASGLTAGYGVVCIGNNNTSAFVGFGAEL